MTLSVILNILIVAVGVIIHMIGFGYLFFNRSIRISPGGHVSLDFTGKYSGLILGLWILETIIMAIGGVILVNAVIY